MTNYEVSESNDKEALILNLGWPDIVKASSKIVSFFDLCGHRKYLKTGITSSFPDMCFIVVGGNMGMNRLTREHIALCVSLRISFSIIITKIDICKDRKQILDETIRSVNKLIKLPGLRRVPYKVKTQDDLLVCIKNIYSEKIVTIKE